MTIYGPEHDFGTYSQRFYPVCCRLEAASDVTYGKFVGLLLIKPHKVITTMLIGLLDDRTYCAQSAFTQLGLWFIASLHNQPVYLKLHSIDIFINLQPVG